MARITRRQFLIGFGTFGSVSLGMAGGLLGRRWWERVPYGPVILEPKEPPTPWSVEAKFYASFGSEGSLSCDSCHSLNEDTPRVSYCHIPHVGDQVRCNLCPHQCIIADGQRGTCRVKENRGGRLFSVVYGNPCAVHVDPIEKKPFFHFLPGAAAFSIATAGCNLRCLYCQNWSISQFPPEETENIDLPPGDVVRYARQAEAPVIAYTYSEPTAYYEYMLATAQLARQAGIRNVVVSAGFMNPEPLQQLCEAVDAIKIDLKGYDPGFYREVCGAELGPVLDALRVIHESGIHLEIVNLVVPTLNDDTEQLRSLARWVASELGPDVPLHFSRFYPQYKLTNLPPTPEETVDEARTIALQEGMRFVYVGNVPGHPGNSTYCPSCGRVIILREGFAVVESHLRGDACVYCGTKIPGVWWPEGSVES